MRSKLYAVAGACLAVAAFALPGVATAAPALAAPGPSPTAASPSDASLAEPTLHAQPQGGCAKPTSLLQAQCLSVTIPRGKKTPGASTAASAVTAPLAASQLQDAYGVTSASSGDGIGETVAIIDPYRDPTIVGDLATYRANNGLPACDSSTGAGCLTVYNENGAVINPATATSPPTPPDTASDDEMQTENETALDTEMVSAICPNCKIALFEANTFNLDDMGVAEDSAAKIAKFISNSWGLDEDFPYEAAYDSYFNHPGVAVVFASGDFGYGASYPASSQFVTSVGGTYLDEASSSGPWTQTVWNGQGEGSTGYGTAAGCSAGEPEPSWGVDAADSTAASLCANRTDNDVSAVASAAYGIGIYSSTTDSVNPYNTCGGSCGQLGTSVAAPIITAMYALAGNPEANTYPASYLYQDPSGLTPVTSGTDEVSGSPLKCESSRQYLCNAADSLTSPYKGYNGPAGLGTPNGNLTPFTESKTGDIVSLANPGTYDVERAATISLPALKGIDSASGEKLTYSASGLPAGVSINSSTGVISGKVTNIENDTVHVTAKDSTGASATVSFRLEASLPMTTSYKSGIGYVSLDIVNGDGYGMCMNDAGNSSNNASKVEIWTCTDKDGAQAWLFEPQPAPGNYDENGFSQLGTMRIHGKCLSVDYNGTADGSLLELYTCDGGAGELWEITGASGQLYNPNSGKCIEDANSSTANGKQLEISNCSTTDAPDQNWLLPASPFDSAVSGKCINVAGNSTANGAAIVSYTCNGATNEKLEVPTTSEYALLEVNGKCLNATNNGTVDGTLIQLYSCTYDGDEVYPANLWMLTAYGQLENAQSQKCLAIPNNSTANGQRLELEDCYGEPGELWATS